jgi:hypothetical protein
VAQLARCNNACSYNGGQLDKGNVNDRRAKTPAATARWGCSRVQNGKYRISSQNYGRVTKHYLLFFICNGLIRHEWTAMDSLNQPRSSPLPEQMSTLVVMPTLMTKVLQHKISTTTATSDLMKTLKNNIKLRRPLQLIVFIDFNFYSHVSCIIGNKILEAQTESNCDSIDGNKGSVLYAPPELLAQHFVFLLNKCNKGGTISYTQSKNIPTLLISVNYQKIDSRLCKNMCKFWPETDGENLFRTEKARHRSATAMLALIHDIESNPGPAPAAGCRSNITVVSLNCRGLGNTDKTRLLLNKIYALPQNQPLIVMLQETMIVSGKYLELAWRGKFIQTAGTGNSQGCITLVGADSDITEVQHYGNRGHFFKLRLGTGEILKICNIYAPNGFDANKTVFFNMVLQDTANWDGPLIIGGDFNTTLGPGERHNRSVTAAETRVADMLKEYTLNQNLNDCWDGNAGYTWRKGKSMSRLDRIYTRTPDYIGYIPEHLIT